MCELQATKAIAEIHAERVSRSSQQQSEAEFKGADRPRSICNGRSTIDFVPRIDIGRPVDAFIANWSHRRSFRQILNSILGLKAGSAGYIGKKESYATMMRAYRAAILMIHPDKHAQSTFEIRYKAAEMFKVVTNLCARFRKKHQKSA